MSGKEKKNRKYGRNKKSPSMSAYNITNRAEKNRLRKLKKHMKQHENDHQSARALNYAKANKRRIAA